MQLLPMQRISHILDMYYKMNAKKPVKTQNKIHLLKVFIEGKYDDEKVGNATFIPQICMRLRRMAE